MDIAWYDSVASPAGLLFKVNGPPGTIPKGICGGGRGGIVIRKCEEIKDCLFRSLDEVKNVLLQIDRNSQR